MNNVDQFADFCPFFYFTDYDEDVNNALQTLRQYEFECGRYYSALVEKYPDIDEVFYLDFPIDEKSVFAEPVHADIKRALEDSDYETMSILDLLWASPNKQDGGAVPFDINKLIYYFGTKFPSKKTVLNIMRNKLDTSSDLWNDIFLEGKWRAYHMVIYEDNHPREICFFGIFIDE